MGMTLNIKQSDIYLLDKTTGNKIPLFKEAHVLGRASEDINFQDPAVSRQHCRMVRRGNQFYLEDLNSVNKTFVNNLALTPQSHHALKHGDVLRIGRQTLIFANRSQTGFLKDNSGRYDLAKSLSRSSLTAPLKTQVSFERGSRQKTVQIVIATFVLFSFVMGGSLIRNHSLTTGPSAAAANREIASIPSATLDKVKAPDLNSGEVPAGPESTTEDPSASLGTAPLVDPQPTSAPEAATSSNESSGDKNFEPPMQNPFDKPSARNEVKDRIAEFPELKNQ